MAQKRLLEFDIAKALCIILVVMGHYAVTNPSWWVSVHDIIYTFHMPLFLFASGFIYIAFKKDDSYSCFLLKKVKRLLIPYVATSIIVVTIKLLTQSFLYVENPVTITSYFRILYLPEAGYFLWFIWVLLWLFCIVPLFKTRISRTILFVVFLITHYTSPYLNLPELFCINELANKAIWFMLGVMCYDWKVVIDNVKGYQVGFAFVVFMLVIVLPQTCDFTDLFKVKWGGQFVDVLKPYVGILFIMFLSKWISQYHVPQIVLLVSTSTYVIYLFHTTFMGFTKALLMRIPIMESIPVISIILVVITGVIFPIILSKLFEKNRITRFIFGIR